MRVSAAKPADAPRLAAVMAGWLNETPWIPNLHTSAEDQRFLRRLIDTVDVIALRNWRGPQGFLARDGEVVHALYLAPKARGRGHGTRLLDVAKTRVPRLELWCFQANTGARAFYAREGFLEVEQTDGAGNDEKLPDVRLVWEKE